MPLKLSFEGIFIKLKTFLVNLNIQSFISQTESPRSFPDQKK